MYKKGVSQAWNNVQQRQKMKGNKDENQSQDEIEKIESIDP